MKLALRTSPAPGCPHTAPESAGRLVMLGAYAVIAPLLFFLPLGAAHRTMLEARNRFLRPISRTCQEALAGLRGISLDESGAQSIESLRRLEALRVDLRKKIPVWPFDFRTWQAFFGTIVVPLLPIVLPITIELFLHGPGRK